MYFPYFAAYMGIGLTLSVVVFAWALGSGQFREQQRVRYLPMRDRQDDPPATANRAARWEIYGLFALAVAGLATSAAVLVFSLVTAG